MCYLVCLGDRVFKTPLVLNFNLLLHQLTAHQVAGKQPELRTERKTHKTGNWNSSNPDTNGAEESVHISEVSSFQWCSYVSVDMHRRLPNEKYGN